jgi:hypothetical protein
LKIRYEICPACGFDNVERKPACPACDNRLFSDGEEEHRRYVLLIESEYRKQSLLFYCGWAFVAFVFIAPNLLMTTGRIGWAPGYGLIVGAMVVGWRLIDLKKKRAASALFLAKHKNA